MPFTLQQSCDLIVTQFNGDTWCQPFLDFLQELISKYGDSFYWYAEVVDTTPGERNIVLVCLFGPELSFIVQETHTTLHLTTKWSSWNSNGLMADKTTDPEASQHPCFKSYTWKILDDFKM